MRVFNLVLALAILGPVANHAQVANEPGVESKLMALEQIEKIQAPRSQDVKALDAMLDDAFTSVDMTGKVLDKTATLAQVRTADSIEFVPNSLAVRLHRDTAIVTGLYWLRGKQQGNPLVRYGRFVDTWLYKSGRWVAIASVSTPSETH